MQPRVRVPVVASLTDPDEVTAALTGEVGQQAGGQDGVVPSSDISWRWYNSDDGSTWVEIDDERSASYTPGPSDANKYLRAVGNLRRRTG